MSLNNKVAIVTGAGSGIGAAIAVKFAAEGAMVALVGRTESKLAAVAKDIEKLSRKPLIIAADVTKDDDAKRIINETIKHFGKIHILINNAGIGESATILDLACLKTFDKVMNTNLRSVVVLTHLAAPHLVATKGNITNISSAAALMVVGRGNFSYCVSKAALNHFTRCVALEFAEKGVRVNCINPGPFKTDIMVNSGADSKTADALWEQMKDCTALKRLGDVEELADLAAFIASDRGRSITGSSYAIDNGFLIQGPDTSTTSFK